MEAVQRIVDIIKNRDAWQIIDVRSPGEFNTGHIPGAINIPLFNDEERARVGTLYKQVSPEAALKEGLQISGLKMNTLVDTVKPYKCIDGKEILVHCWRGGKRSQAIQWLFNFAGVRCYRLDGGYKSYRQALKAFFAENIFELKILGGCTGSGKTEILDELASYGSQIVDLEKIAHHKGSAFGSIGESPQPTTEQFENNLFKAFLSLEPDCPVWLENESKSIGKVHIPDGLWHQMRQSVLYNIDVEKEIRLDRTLKYYSEPINIDMLKTSFEKIKKRLGGLDFQLAIKALAENDLRTAAAIALTYYDKSYNYQIESWPSDKVMHVTQCNDVADTAKKLIRI